MEKLLALSQEKQATIRKWWDSTPPAVRVQDGHITVRVTPSQAVSDLLVEALGQSKD